LREVSDVEDEQFHSLRRLSLPFGEMKNCPYSDLVENAPFTAGRMATATLISGLGAGGWLLLACRCQ
jgi:hypothetical protein